MQSQLKQLHQEILQSLRKLYAQSLHENRPMEAEKIMELIREIEKENRNGEATK